jgi:hypothetical protein
MRLNHIPLRLTTGALILNAGWGKRKLDRDNAAGLQAMAAKIIPPVSRIEAEKFGKMLSYAERTLGAALLAPFLPSRLAGIGLGIFSGIRCRQGYSLGWDAGNRSRPRGRTAPGR